jgi:hypothetical protein
MAATGRTPEVSLQKDSGLTKNICATFLMPAMSMVGLTIYFMKHIRPLIVFALVIFTAGCKKNNTETVSNSIKGTWELRYVVGGYRAPGANPDYASGNGNIWEFSDSTYQYYANSQLLGQGSYSITKDTSLATGRYMDALILDNNNSAKLFFEISNNELTLYRGVIAADGTIETYRRIGN